MFSGNRPEDRKLHHQCNVLVLYCMWESKRTYGIVLGEKSVAHRGGRPLHTSEHVACRSE